jgi:peptidyl-dipeptidase Dcp
VQRRTFLASAAATGAVAAFNPSLSMAQTTLLWPLIPLTQKWTGPYGGVPAFDKVKVADFKPALEEAMAKNLAEIDAITANKAAPTFDNTIAALEDAGRALGDVSDLLRHLGLEHELAGVPGRRSRDGSEALGPQRQDQSEHRPLRPHRGRLQLAGKGQADARAAARAVDLLPQLRALRRQAGPAAKARIGAINTELAGLFTKFSQNLLADENTWIELTDADLAGLPEGLKAAAGSNAAARKLSTASSSSSTPAPASTRS